jgi:cytochrome b pre-mRNA-processing protein 3
MLWPFNHFLKPRTPSRGTIEAIYGMIVAQAREPLFYQALGVPDTVNGRFDMVVLHLWMVLRQTERLGGGGGLAQALFDRFCSDMDHNLRELGTGDLAVPRRMREFGEAFYGRCAAYDLALAGGEEPRGQDPRGDNPLAQALCRNIFNGREFEQARRLAAYVGQALAVLAGADLAVADEAMTSGASWQFPSPASALEPG